MSGKEKLPRANLEQKIMILNYHHHSGKPQSETVEYYKNQFAISTSSFSEWLKNEKELRIRYNDAQSASSDLSNHMKHQKRKSKFKYDAINKAMHDLVENRRSQHLPINEPILREHWAVFARKFGVDDPKRLQSFSHGWLSQFKKRNGLDRKSMSIGFRYVTRENGEKEMVVDDDVDVDVDDQGNVSNDHHDDNSNNNNNNNNNNSNNNTNPNDTNKVIPTNSSMNKQSNFNEIVMISSDNNQQNKNNKNKNNSHDRNGVNNLLNQNSNNNNNNNNNTSVVGNNQDPGAGTSVNLINSVKPVQSLQKSQQELDQQQHVQQIQHQQHVQQQQQQQQPVHQQINNGYAYNNYPNSSLPSINQQMQVQQQQQQQQQQQHSIPTSSVPSQSTGVQQSSAQSSSIPNSTSAITSSQTSISSVPPRVLGALDVGDMERFIYMWADKFFMDFASDFPRSKDIFDQFKHKFFEERLMYNQRLASQQSNNSVDDFFLRRAR